MKAVDPKTEARVWFMIGIIEGYRRAGKCVVATPSEYNEQFEKFWEVSLKILPRGGKGEKDN